MKTQASGAEERGHMDSLKSSFAECAGSLIGFFPFARSTQTEPVMHVYRVYLPSEILYHHKLKPGIAVMVGIGTVGNKLLRLNDLSEHNKALPFNELSSNDIGKYFFPAELWASHQMPKGMVVLSNALMDAFDAFEYQQNSNLRIALYEMNGEIGICKHVLLQIRLKEPKALQKVMTKNSSLKNVSDASQAESARKDKLKSQTRNFNRPEEQIRNAVPDSTKIQNEVVEDLLKEDFTSRGRLLALLEYVAMQLLEKRYIFLGSIIDMPFLGVNLRLEVIELLTENSLKKIGRICARTALKISSTTLEGRFSDNSIEAFEYAARAVKALKEAGDFGEPEAAQAVQNAAIAGFNSINTPSSLGGLKYQIAMLRRLASSKLFSGPLPYSSSGVLLHGPPGTGKTALARTIAADLNFVFFVVNGPELVSEHLGHSETCLRAVFLAARSLAPAVIFIDEIDAIAPSREGQQQLSVSGMSSRLISTLATELDFNEGHEVIVIAATNRVSALDESLRRPGRIDQEIEVGVPSSIERLDILKAILSTVVHVLDETMMLSLAQETHGFVGADLQALCNEAAMSALRKRIYHQDSNELSAVSWEDFMFAKSLVKASGLRDASFEIPKLSWEDIGGYEEVKQQLKEVISWPQHHKASLLRVGARPPRGVLMYGPPGCSKTALATAAANEASMNFLIVKGPELYNKYVGETEKTLAKIFQRARNSSPAIIFFDELDGLVVSRDDGITNNGVDINQRILSVLLQEMDKLETESYDLVVLAATNRPDMLDQALLRPGRLDRLLYLPLPTFEDRKKIFKVHLGQEYLRDDVDISILARDTDGFSGADIAALCQEARYIALEKDINASEVSIANFLQAMKRVFPTASRLDPQLVAAYKKFKRNIDF